MNLGSRTEIAARAVRLLVIHVPPRRRGIRLTHLAERWAGTPSEPLTARHVSGFKLTCDLRDTVQRALFYCGTYEPQTTALIRSALASGDTFLDIGANVGHYTFLAAKAVGPAGRVIAIEASKSTAERLAADVTSNGLDHIVTVHNVAAADEASSVFLYAGHDPSQVGMRHLDPSPRDDAIEATRQMPLDDLLPGLRTDVVKLDIEGAELRALVGMRHILTNHRPRLVVAEMQEEMLARFGDSPDTVNAFFTELGYEGREVGEKWHGESRSFSFRTP